MTQETEDVVHWIIIKRLEGKCKKQYLSHSVLDVLRSKYEFINPADIGRKRRTYKKKIILDLNHSIHYKTKKGEWKKTVNEMKDIL